jgi:hypothetical protein
MRNGSLFNLCICEFQLLDFLRVFIVEHLGGDLQGGNRGAKRTFWKLDKILVLLLELELSLQRSVSHGKIFVVSRFVTLELSRRKSRKSLIVISFLPGGVDVCDPMKLRSPQIK